MLAILVSRANLPCLFCDRATLNLIRLLGRVQRLLHIHLAPGFGPVV
jgi:hypothetical protein